MHKNIKNLPKADRFNTNKPKWSIIDFPSIEPLVKALEYGANKYSRDNWKKGLDEDEIIDSTLRHLIKLNQKEDIDEESGVMHEGHIMANMMFLVYQKLNRYNEQK